jgi:hypothetical protein
MRKFPFQVRAKKSEPGFLKAGEVYTVVGENDTCWNVDCEYGKAVSLDKDRFVVLGDEVFDMDAFNKVLQASTNICAAARADIDKAIRAGKGLPEPIKLTLGCVVTVGAKDEFFMVSRCSDEKRWRLMGLVGPKMGRCAHSGTYDSAEALAKAYSYNLTVIAKSPEDFFRGK